MKTGYLTITHYSEGIYKEKGSKFLSFVHPVSAIEDIKQLISGYRKKYPDAQHVCYAYMIGTECNNFRASDDGEPAGTAGKPILGQILANNLTNVLIVVVRYFGGVLLGTGGLVTAYKTAAANALAENRIVEEQVMKQLVITFNYLKMNEIMSLLKEYNLTPSEKKFDTMCRISLQIPVALYQIIVTKLITIGAKHIPDGTFFDSQNAP